MSTFGPQPIAAAWYPDPYSTPGVPGAPGTLLRWWDGTQWTGHTTPAVPPSGYVGMGGSVGYGSSSQMAGGVGSMMPTGIGFEPVQRSFISKNSRSFVTFVVVAIYILIAVLTHVVVIGILPVLQSIRAVQRREPLAALAVIAAVISVLLAFSLLSGG